MDTKRTKQQAGLEATYRRGYHHGFVQGRDLILGLLSSGLPASAIANLCRVFEQQAVIPWRVLEHEGNSAPPRFDLEACQWWLQEDKQHQSDHS